MNLTPRNRIHGADELLKKLQNRTPDEPQVLASLEPLLNETMVDFFEMFLKIPDGSVIFSATYL